ncbi:hypothetical protein NC652_029024 [Populus alba x Populus x berolinensis]|nr:hypothetical protein NC652_029024 [Populus alba x Populus x berolinensis]
MIIRELYSCFNESSSCFFALPSLSAIMEQSFNGAAFSLCST